MTDLDLAAVPGVPETRLPAGLIDELPENLAPAPWQVHCSAVVWWGRAGPAATEALPDALRNRGEAAVVVVGGIVRYEDTPVGPYDEVFGVIGYRSGGRFGSTVAFMAVDSRASLVGGRSNWAMPKTLAEFSGDIAAGRRVDASSAVGGDWRVAATPRRLGPPLPVGSRARVVQQFPDGVLRGSRLAARGWMRPTRVDVDIASSGSLPEWLAPGRRFGAVLPSVAFSLGEPTPQ